MESDFDVDRVFLFNKHPNVKVKKNIPIACLTGDFRSVFSPYNKLSLGSINYPSFNVVFFIVCFSIV